VPSDRLRHLHAVDLRIAGPCCPLPDAAALVDGAGGVHSPVRGGTQLPVVGSRVAARLGQSVEPVEPRRDAVPVVNVAIGRRAWGSCRRGARGAAVARLACVEAGRWLLARVEHGLAVRAAMRRAW
jgi:hypothetical protein